MYLLCFYCGSGPASVWYMYSRNNSSNWQLREILVFKNNSFQFIYNNPKEIEISSFWSKSCKYAEIWIYSKFPLFKKKIPSGIKRCQCYSGVFIFFDTVIFDYSLSSSDVSKLLSAVDFYILILIFNLVNTMWRRYIFNIVRRSHK